MPRVLSPLRCASYGWVNVDRDMLKCSSCQAFLCASLLPPRDYLKYESRIAEISKQLQTQHEKFCPWPDSPCPDRFWLITANEPSVLLSAFLERFQGACLLGLQLPAMTPEHLKAMSLTEEVISVLLQLIEEQQKKLGRTPMSESLGVQVAACIVALCGWAASPTLHAMSLPCLTCSYCMRKVGLWNFRQMEGTVGESVHSSLTIAHPATPATPTPSQDGRGDGPTPTSPSQPLTPCRMSLRSRDATRSQSSDKAEGSLSPLAGPGRVRSVRSPSPSEEQSSPSPSPVARGKRPATRSRQGDGTGGESSPSPQSSAKRFCLAIAGNPADDQHRNVFEPLAQHRNWCPWVYGGKETTSPKGIPFPDGDLQQDQPGWKAVLNLLLPMKKNSTLAGSSPHDKSKKVFAIFRQWQVSSPSQ